MTWSGSVEQVWTGQGRCEVRQRERDGGGCSAWCGEVGNMLLPRGPGAPPPGAPPLVTWRGKVTSSSYSTVWTLQAGKKQGER